MDKRAWACIGAVGLVTASCAAMMGSGGAGEDRAAEATAMMKASFKAHGQARLDRIDQDETQRLCTQYHAGVPMPPEVAQRIERGELATIRYPADGKYLGDWKNGEKIAQSGQGKQYSDDPAKPSGGNCYACHQLTARELSYGTIGPSLLHFGRTRGYTAHYEVPYRYWLLGFTASGYDYRQRVAGANQTYIYRGSAENAELRLSRLLYRDAVRKTSAYVAGWLRNSHNYIDDTEIEVQRRRMAGWELGVTHREFIAAAIFDTRIGYRRGTGMLSALVAPEELFGEGTSRSALITADAQLNVPFGISKQRFRYAASWRAQWNRTPLVPQDRFQIGGRYTVRGFDGESTLLGERGWLLRNDLGWTIGRTGHELYLGVDYGEVSGPSTPQLIGTRLAGAVVGVRGGYKHFMWDLFAGRPLSKPDGFQTASTTAGFNLLWSY